MAGHSKLFKPLKDESLVKSAKSPQPMMRRDPNPPKPECPTCRRKWPDRPEFVAWLVASYQGGLSLVECSDASGVNIAALGRILRDCDVQIRSRGRRISEHPPPMVREWFRLATGEGRTLAQIGQTYGVSKQAVHQALEYWGNRIERREKDRATSPKKAKRRKTKGPSTSLKLAREWIRLFTKEGWTVERIAEAFNRDVDAVRSIVDFWLPSNR